MLIGNKQRVLWYFPKRPIALGHYIASNSFYVSHVLSKLFACTKDRHTQADQTQNWSEMGGLWFTMSKCLNCWSKCSQIDTASNAHHPPWRHVKLKHHSKFVQHFQFFSFRLWYDKNASTANCIPLKGVIKQILIAVSRLRGVSYFGVR